MSDKKNKSPQGAKDPGKLKEEQIAEPTEVELPAGSPISSEAEDKSGQAPAESLVPEEDDIEKYRREAEEYKDRWLRAVADLDNYRKRVAKEREELIHRGTENVLREMILVMDNLERALNHANESENASAVIEGIHRILDQFSSALKKLGVDPIQAKGIIFDPYFHEAVMQVESRDLPPNTVVEELEKGYMLNDRLLRPAKVSVAKSPEDAE